MSEKEREELTRLTRRYRSQQQVVLRAGIILAAAQGASTAQIAREWDTTVDTVEGSLGKRVWARERREERGPPASE